MTTLTRVLLNPERRQARRLITNPQVMHAAVRAAFPPDLNESARVLWRLDKREHEHVLYIVGPEASDASHIVEQAGWATRPAEIANYAPFADALLRGQHWNFELVANPTKSVPVKGGKRGKVVPLVGDEGQSAWLLDRAQRHGFVAKECVIVERNHLRFAKSAEDNRRKVTLGTVRYRGVLEVTSPELLRAALFGGIGRGRAYGCGLLTLAQR
ncbi:type I-E CRISPR-associated protein Cas6/Cse3/CasE [Corynebacterium sp. SCR221107]|uniref:type I-E CRISPR-associated protein Cas6/Cse3/CasE n=1 Tax=Corynebacterium sp. SCR221107 TaxID=3017361 RepID=UPI0022EC30EF|nr:type I-E CRISPR-associated protein Cas6/Cse3/CasE [Corynebacterium sp. SCR221107]WBT08236.1 type I-E CRISPR-associated protein Cas6/Cse3/CasE [Corynebacterium sp. SCR221107]